MADFDLAGMNLPFSLEAEQSVIGAVVMKGDEVLGDIVTTLHPEHFYADVNRGIYEILVTMFMASEKIDIVTAIEACQRHGVFKTAEEAKKYISDAISVLPSTSSAIKYAKMITEKYMLRCLIFASKEIAEAANNSSDSAEDIINFAEKKIYDIRSGSDNSSLTHIRGIVYDRVNALDELIKQSRANNGKPVMTGLETGFTHVDKQIYGLNKSDLIILAARPGMGKTSFAMNLAIGAAKKNQKAQVCVFSLEMSKEQIVSRVLSSEARISSEAMKTGKITNDQISQIMQASEFLQHLEIYIDDTPALNIMSMKSKLRRMKNLGLVIVDYLQLMSSSTNYNGNRVAEMSEITRNLKIMAKELNVPVIALSQLARGPEQRPDKRPLLSDLRDSGSIEQDADIVIFLYRNAYYDKTDPNQNVCECIIAKNRHGSTGMIPIGWEGEFTRFYNVDFKHADAPPAG